MYRNIEQESDITFLRTRVVGGGTLARKVCKLIIKYKETPIKKLKI